MKAWLCVHAQSLSMYACLAGEVDMTKLEEERRRYPEVGWAVVGFDDGGRTDCEGIFCIIFFGRPRDY
jgi:hypothetical protein